MPGPDPTRAAARAVRSLELRANATRAAGARAYFKTYDTLEFFGVPAPEIRSLAKAIALECREWTLAEAVRFAEAMLSRPELEAKTLGACVLGRFRAVFDASTLPLTRRWISEWCHDWASTDTLCAEVIAPLLVRQPRLVARLRPWRTSPALYVRRASAVALVPLARKGLALDEAYETVRALTADREDLIQKAAGWLLREAGKTDPVRLETFLRRTGHRLGRTTVRYAIERFEPRRRRELLEVTKARPDATRRNVSGRRSRPAPARSG